MEYPGATGKLNSLVHAPEIRRIDWSMPAVVVNRQQAMFQNPIGDALPLAVAYLDGVPRGGSGARSR